MASPRPALPPAPNRRGLPRHRGRDEQRLGLARGRRPPPGAGPDAQALRRFPSPPGRPWERVPVPLQRAAVGRGYDANPGTVNRCRFRIFDKLPPAAIDTALNPAVVEEVGITAFPCLTDAKSAPGARAAAVLHRRTSTLRRHGSRRRPGIRALSIAAPRHGDRQQDKRGREPRQPAPRGGPGDCVQSCLL